MFKGKCTCHSNHRHCRNSNKWYYIV